MVKLVNTHAILEEGREDPIGCDADPTGKALPPSHRGPRWEDGPLVRAGCCA